jgi:hypothetical protein
VRTPWQQIGGIAPNAALRKTLKKLFELKARGPEEKYISELQHAKDLKNCLRKS